jgi:hypothetical protein
MDHPTTTLYLSYAYHQHREKQTVRIHSNTGDTFLTWKGFCNDDEYILFECTRTTSVVLSDFVLGSRTPDLRFMFLHCKQGSYELDPNDHLSIVRLEEGETIRISHLDEDIYRLTLKLETVHELENAVLSVLRKPKFT